FFLMFYDVIKICGEHHISNGYGSIGGGYTEILERDSNTYGGAFVVKSQWFINNDRFYNSNPRSLANMQLVESDLGCLFCNIDLNVQKYQTAKPNDGSTDGDPIKPFGNTYLPFPISLLFILPLFLFGGWLSNRIIDVLSPCLVVVIGLNLVGGMLISISVYIWV